MYIYTYVPYCPNTSYFLLQWTEAQPIIGSLQTIEVYMLSDIAENKRGAWRFESFSNIYAKVNNQALED